MVGAEEWLEGGGGAEPPGAVGTTVGTVEGWRAVFQVAVVGQGVVATAGEVVAYGLGPGTRKQSSEKIDVNHASTPTYCRRS